MSVVWTDTHAHVNDAHFAGDRDAAIERAQAAGVGTFVEIAESIDMWDKAAALAERFPFVYASLGIHPHHAHEIRQSEWPAIKIRLRDLMRHPKVVAIGEFGLDYHRMQNTKDEQLFLLREQLAIAQEMKKPIVIHCREANPIAADFRCHADLQTELNRFYTDMFPKWSLPSPAGVIHCFSGTWEDAQFYMARGFMLGVDGPVTYPSAKPLQDHVRRMPLERLVLETDSPYLPPQPHRGQRNEPSYLPMVGEAIAKLKNLSLDAVALATSANARALFRLS